MSDGDDIPAGYRRNTDDDNQRIAAATSRVMKELDGTVRAVAMVFLTPEGQVTASLAAEDMEALALLAARAPETLRLTVERLKIGKGTTTLIVNGVEHPLLLKGTH